MCYLHVLPCKILGFYPEKCLNYGHFSDIWFGFVCYGVWVLSGYTTMKTCSDVWFDFVWYGIWVLSRHTTMQNF